MNDTDVSEFTLDVSLVDAGPAATGYATNTEDIWCHVPHAVREGRRQAFMGSFDGGAVFNLDEPTRSEALGLAGSELFDPSGGHPMREWVVVRAHHQDRWTTFAEAALDKVRLPLAGRSRSAPRTRWCSAAPSP